MVITKHKNFIHLEKRTEKGLVTLCITPLPGNLFKLSYIGGGVTKTMSTHSLIAPRVVASLLGEDYGSVSAAMRGVA